MTIIAPSILSMDFSDTKAQVSALEKSSAKWMHFDVMDGHFVPNLTFGPDILKAMKQSSTLLMDVHVMIEEPKRYAKVFIEAGAQVYTFHYEAMQNKAECLELAKEIRKMGCKAGLSIKPKTSAEEIIDLIAEFDLILVMSVEPGFGGQKFDPAALHKIKTLKEKITSIQSACLIEVDGGINQETGAQCVEAGADVLVAGSYIFKQDIVEGVASLL